MENIYFTHSFQIHMTYCAEVTSTEVSQSKQRSLDTT